MSKRQHEGYSPQEAPPEKRQKEYAPLLKAFNESDALHDWAHPLLKQYEHQPAKLALTLLSNFPHLIQSSKYNHLLASYLHSLLAASETYHQNDLLKLLDELIINWPNEGNDVENLIYELFEFFLLNLDEEGSIPGNSLLVLSKLKSWLTQTPSLTQWVPPSKIGLVFNQAFEEATTPQQKIDLFTLLGDLLELNIYLFRETSEPISYFLHGLIEEGMSSPEHSAQALKLLGKIARMRYAFYETMFTILTALPSNLIFTLFDRASSTPNAISQENLAHVFCAIGELTSAYSTLTHSLNSEILFTVFDRLATDSTLSREHQAYVVWTLGKLAQHSQHPMTHFPILTTVTLFDRIISSTTPCSNQENREALARSFAGITQLAQIAPNIVQHINPAAFQQALCLLAETEDTVTEKDDFFLKTSEQNESSFHAQAIWTLETLSGFDPEGFSDFQAGIIQNAFHQSVECDPLSIQNQLITFQAVRKLMMRFPQKLNNTICSETIDSLFNSIIVQKHPIPLTVQNKIMALHELGLLISCQARFANAVKHTGIAALLEDIQTSDEPIDAEQLFQTFLALGKIIIHSSDLINLKWMPQRIYHLLSLLTNTIDLSEQNKKLALESFKNMLRAHREAFLSSMIPSNQPNQNLAFLFAVTCHQIDETPLAIRLVSQLTLSKEIYLNMFQFLYYNSQTKDLLAFFFAMLGNDQRVSDLEEDIELKHQIDSNTLSYTQLLLCAANGSTTHSFYELLHHPKCNLFACTPNGKSLDTIISENNALSLTQRTECIDALFKKRNDLRLQTGEHTLLVDFSKIVGSTSLEKKLLSLIASRIYQNILDFGYLIPILPELHAPLFSRVALTLGLNIPITAEAINPASSVSDAYVHAIAQKVYDDCSPEILLVYLIPPSPFNQELNLEENFKLYAKTYGPLLVDYYEADHEVLNLIQKPCATATEQEKTSYEEQCAQINLLAWIRELSIERAYQCFEAGRLSAVTLSKLEHHFTPVTLLVMETRLRVCLRMEMERKGWIKNQSLELNDILTAYNLNNLTPEQVQRWIQTLVAHDGLAFIIRSLKKANHDINPAILTWQAPGAPTTLCRMLLSQPFFISELLGNQLQYSHSDTPSGINIIQRSASSSLTLSAPFYHLWSDHLKLYQEFTHLIHQAGAMHFCLHYLENQSYLSFLTQSLLDILNKNDLFHSADSFIKLLYYAQYVLPEQHKTELLHFFEAHLDKLAQQENWALYWQVSSHIKTTKPFEALKTNPVLLVSLLAPENQQAFLYYLHHNNLSTQLNSLMAKLKDLYPEQETIIEEMGETLRLRLPKQRPQENIAVAQISTMQQGTFFASSSNQGGAKPDIDYSL